MITITITLTEKQEKQLHQARGKTPVLQYLKKHFQTKNLTISEGKKKKEHPPSWLSDVEKWEKELNEI